jgi:hypothetical protein
MNEVRREADRARKCEVETRDETLFIKERDQDDREHGDDRHQLHIASADGRRLSEEKFVDAAFVSGRQALNHRHQADADREKGGQHQPESSVFFQPRGLFDKTDHGGA